MDENKFVDKMTLKSDEELKNMFLNKQKYVSEALEAAAIVLKQRGINFENAEIIVEQRKVEEETEKEKLINQDYWDTTQQVNDETAPILYSKRVIYSFSLFFSVLFGAALMLINLRALKKTEGVVPTLSFSIAYFLSIIYLFDFLESHYKIVVPNTNIFSFLGAWLILELVWNKYIGKEIKYRKKGITIPLVIGIIIIGLFIALYSLAQHN